MNGLQVFSYNSSEVRTVMRDGEPWFVLKDVCVVLGLSNPTAVVERLDKDERAKFDLGRQGKTWLINESGLYSLALSSKLPSARKFRRWVTSEVLPSIRKHGGYIAGQEHMSDN